MSDIQEGSVQPFQSSNPNLSGSMANSAPIELTNLRPKQETTIRVKMKEGSESQGPARFRHFWSTPTEVAVSEEQAKLYWLPDPYRVAKFDKRSVAKILEKQRPKDKEIYPSGRLWSRVKENFKVSSTVRRIVHYPVLFLIGYYTIQICYQLDLLCSTTELKNIGASAPQSIPTIRAPAKALDSDKAILNIRVRSISTYG